MVEPKRFPSLSRRGFLLLGAGAVGTAALGACSGGRTQPSRVATDGPQVRAAEAARRTAGAAVREVRLSPAPTELDLGGVVVRTWAYGGDLPGREIRLRRGEVLRAEVANGLPQDTTVHWHGLALRNDMDGVPGLTQPPVAPGATFVYEFTAPDAGTHWFHPHVGVQLDRGLYAPLIVEDPDDGADYDSELVIVLDDWLDGIDGADPDSTLAGLLERGMGGMDHAGMSGMARSELLGGDAGDITYPHMLANGRIAGAAREHSARPGERIRLRLVNAASDTVFKVGVPGVAIRVTHTDGFPVDPVEGDAVLLGMGERVDAVVTVPDTAVPVLALAEGRDGFAQVVLRPTPSGGGADAAMVGALKARPALTVADYTASDTATLGRREPDTTHDLVLGGPGDLYDWTINGRAFDHADPFAGSLQVTEGQRVLLRFRNESTMFHPMHLHGHTFQVRRAGGVGPRKDTAIVLPQQTLEVEFDAVNPGQWLTHCHNIYHGEAGMMAVVSYTA
jgi:FtsP/CotA-like multicopper oxidase with cupredoxin domain